MVYHISGGAPDPKLAGILTQVLIPVDGDFDKVELIDPSQDGRWGVSFRTGGSGRPIDTTHMPTRLRRKGNEEFPFYEVARTRGKGLLVTEKFKQIVERFEPDVHQFLPVDIEQRGKVIAKRYFFYICNRLDTLAKDACIPAVGKDEHYMPNYDGNDKMVFSTKKIGSCHAWHDKYTIGRFMSDELVTALAEQNFLGMGHQKFDQV